MVYLLADLTTSSMSQVEQYSEYFMYILVRTIKYNPAVKLRSSEIFLYCFFIIYGIK